MEHRNPTRSLHRKANVSDAGCELRGELLTVAEALKENRYRAGLWQRFVSTARLAPATARAELAPQITAVSQLVHSQRRPKVYPLGLFSAVETLIMLAGVAALVSGLGNGGAVLLLLAAILLAASLQPLVKGVMGRLLGIRFSYGYVMGIEPRYKLAFGTYLAAPPARRIAYHLSGTVGSVLGLCIVGAASLSTHPALGAAILGLAGAMAAIQCVFFVAVLLGNGRLPLIGQVRFTSAGAAAEEVRASKTSPLSSR